MRGYALKKLLIDGISNKIANKDVHIIKYYSNKVTKESWALKVTKVEYFKTRELMRKMKDFLKQVTETEYVLYVPNSTNYGLIDCVLMNVEPVKSSKEEENGKLFEVTLYLLQSTINIGTHEKGDIIIQKDTSKDEDCGHGICNVFFFLLFCLIIFARS